MKLSKLALTLTTAALLPAFAYAGTDKVADSFDRAFLNDAYTAACSGKEDPARASFDRVFADEQIVHAYRTNADRVKASFDRDLSHEPVAMGSQFAKASLLDVINSSLNLGNGTVVASFERDLLGNAVTEAWRTDSILASFVRDMEHEPVAIAAAVTQGGDAFGTTEPDTILANFYRELHWAPDASAVYVR